MSSTIVIMANNTITSSGSFTTGVDTDQEFTLFWNIAGSVTGTNPTIQFRIEEVDPFDQATPNGGSVISSVISTSSVGRLTLSLIGSNTIVVSWTVTGTNPSFSNVSIIGQSKGTGNTIASGSVPVKSLYDLSSSSVIYVGTAPVGTATSAASWFIKKVTLDASGSPTSTLWSSYTAVWDNRAAEIYN